MDWLGLGHFWTALLAIAAGAVVVFKRKGTRFHRRAGRVYLAAMLAVNFSAFAIFDLYGHFGPFHVAAAISLFSVLMGVIAAWRRKPAHGWRVAHAYWMCWSYVGLLAAAVSETSTRYLDYHFGWTVGIATGAVILAGAMVINHRLPTMLNIR